MNQDLLTGARLAAWPFTGLAPGTFKCISADPPWDFKNFSEKGWKKGPHAQYHCMTLQDIQALPVNDLADPAGCVLTMWATAPLLPEAIATMTAWGFSYKTAGAWAKQSSTGRKWAFGPGYILRSAAEFYIVGTIGKPRRISRSVRNLIVASTREHSRKPDQMREDQEALWPGPRLELFAREQFPGWAAWGNEVDKFNERERA